VILQGDLQTGLGGLGTAGDEDHALEAVARRRLHDLRQLFEGVAREGVAIAMSDLVELVGDGGVDLLVAVADAIDGRAAGAVDVALAAGVIDVGALAPGDLRERSGAE